MKDINQIVYEIYHSSEYNYIGDRLRHDPYASATSDIIHKLIDELARAKYMNQFLEHGQEISTMIDVDNFKLKSFKGCRLQDIRIVSANDLQPMRDRIKFDTRLFAYNDAKAMTCADNEPPILTTVDTEKYDTFLIAKFLVDDNGIRKIFSNDVLKEVKDMSNYELLTEVNKRILKRCDNDGKK